MRRMVQAVIRKEGTVLFIDALNTFYLRLYGVKHMVKDHSDSEKGNPLQPQRLARVLLYAPSHRHDSIYHGLVTPNVDSVTYTLCRIYSVFIA